MAMDHSGMWLADRAAAAPPSSMKSSADLRNCYRQILRPSRHLPKFADGLWRRLDAGVHIDSHFIAQAPRTTWSAAMLLGLPARVFFRLGLAAQQDAKK